MMNEDNTVLWMDNVQGDLSMWLRITDDFLQNLLFDNNLL